MCIFEVMASDIARYRYSDKRLIIFSVFIAQLSHPSCTVTTKGIGFEQNNRSRSQLLLRLFGEIGSVELPPLSAPPFLDFVAFGSVFSWT